MGDVMKTEQTASVMKSGSEHCATLQSARIHAIMGTVLHRICARVNPDGPGSSATSLKNVLPLPSACRIKLGRTTSVTFSATPLDVETQIAKTESMKNPVKWYRGTVLALRTD